MGPGKLFGASNLAAAIAIWLYERLELAISGVCVMVKLEFRWILLALFLGTGLLTNPAAAITVEVAKKCNLLVAKAFPPVQPGNPAAGSKGKSPDAQAYFRKCVDNGGNIVDAPPKQ
jgi:hypothetical protein